MSSTVQTTVQTAVAPNGAEVMRQIRVAVEQAFTELVPSLAVWTERRRGEVRIVAEFTREVAATLLAVAGDTALEYGAELSLRTTPQAAEGRFMVVAELTLRIGDLSLTRTGIGESTEVRTIKDKRTGEIVQEADDNAVRAAETRAVKRALEMFVPAIGLKLERISQWLTAWAAKTPQNAGEDDNAYARRGLKALVDTMNTKRK